MDVIRKMKRKTRSQVFWAKFICYFNHRVKGVRAKYNLSYGEDKKYNSLDVMSTKAEGRYPCVIYLHGGGWSAYDKSLFRSTAKTFASRGAVVFNCNFRLAPEYNFKDMEEDVAKIFRFVESNAAAYGGMPNKIIVAGDSSGAHLLSLYVNRQIKEGGADAARVIGCVYFYGVYDLNALDKGQDFKNREAYIAAAMPKMEGREEYLKEYSPVTYLTAGHPPALFCCGLVDPLTENQTLPYIQKLKALDVRTEELIFPADDSNGRHRFITFYTNPAAQKSFAAFDEFLKSLADGV